MKSENKNFILNAAYQMLTYVFPLITVSYISRSLGVDNVGIYSYTYSIVYMFMLFGMLGIHTYGNRTIAKVRDNKIELSKEFFSIYQLQLGIGLLSLFGYVLYLIFICKEYKVVAMLQTLHLISILFDISWFYFGLEKFKVTIIRNFMIKIISMILIFLFVKKPSDLWIYTLVMSGSMVLSQLYLMFHLHKYIDFVKCSFFESKKHFKDVLILFLPVLAFGVYRIMDKTMIGKLSSVTELGYYENAERLINIPISVICALGTVMLPRMAYLLKNDDCDYKKPIFESMKLALIMSTIMMGGLFLISNDISVVLFGNHFLKSGGVLKALSITILVGAWANVIRTQYLIPKSLDKIYVNSTIGGAIVNLILNILLIKPYGAYGACVGTVVAECYVAIYQTIKVKKDIEINKYIKVLFYSMIKTIFIISVSYICTTSVSNMYARLFLNIVIAITLFLLLNYKFIIYDFLGKQK